MSYCNAIEQYANDKRFSIIQLSVGANRDADPGFEGEKTRNKKNAQKYENGEDFFEQTAEWNNEARAECVNH